MDTSTSTRFVDRTPATYAVLAKLYGLTLPTQRYVARLGVEEPATGEVRTARAALCGLREAPRLVTNVEELTTLNAVELVAEHGFVSDNQAPIDPPFALPGALYCMVAVRTQLLLRGVEAITPLKRTVQRVRLDYDMRGAKIGLHLWTYSWPPTGQPGIRVEALSHWPTVGITRRLLWSSLEV